MNDNRADGESSTQCPSCGAQLFFSPGTQTLACKYCGDEVEIDDGVQEEQTAPIERDFEAALAVMEADSAGRQRELAVVRCESCGAQTTFEQNVTSDECAFCGNPLVAEGVHDTSQTAPQYLLPFKVAAAEARKLFAEWIRKLWFAPNALKKRRRRLQSLQGVYLPFYTFDFQVETFYHGQRGTYYYVTERYTTTENGKTVTKTRRKRRTRWRSVSGHVRNAFDDLLVNGTTSLSEKELTELEPWDLQNLAGYDEDYLRGFKAELGSVSLREGFVKAQELAEPTIRSTVKSDIGGDTQRISSMSPSYDDVTYKSILLPVWLSVYRFRNKVYQVFVNARTGEVQGERPWSWVKITLAALAALALVGLAVYGVHVLNTAMGPLDSGALDGWVSVMRTPMVPLASAIAVVRVSRLPAPGARHCRRVTGRARPPREASAAPPVRASGHT